MPCGFGFTSPVGSDNVADCRPINECPVGTEAPPGALSTAQCVCKAGFGGETAARRWTLRCTAQRDTYEIAVLALCDCLPHRQRWWDHVHTVPNWNVLARRHKGVVHALWFWLNQPTWLHVVQPVPAGRSHMPERADCARGRCVCCSVCLSARLWWCVLLWLASSRTACLVCCHTPGPWTDGSLRVRPPQQVIRLLGTMCACHVLLVATLQAAQTARVLHVRLASRPSLNRPVWMIARRSGAPPAHPAWRHLRKPHQLLSAHVCPATGPTKVQQPATSVQQGRMLPAAHWMPASSAPLDSRHNQVCALR